MSIGKKYIIGTGWWCTNKDTRDAKFLNGEDYIRSKAFHLLWAESIRENCNPEKVVVVDSCSPIKAEWSTQLLPYQIIELNKNAGHATNLNGSKFCGWTASVLLSMEYTSLSDCDYYVYVEQDALLFGENIIEYCLDKIGEDTKYAFGKSENNIQPLQQSFFIIRRDAIDEFVSRLRGIKYNDYEISPEFKFAIATSPLLYFLPHIFYKQSKSFFGKIRRRFLSSIFKYIASYKTVPIGYGRERPIDFSRNYFYFQHGSTKELQEYISSKESTKL